MEEKLINVNSPEYMFGQLTAQLTTIERKVDAHNGKIDKLTTAVGKQTLEIVSLPCSVHQERIEKFKAWQDEICEDKTFMARTVLGFRQKVMIALISSGIGAALAVLVSALTRTPSP